MYGGKDIPGRAENGAKIKERKHDDDYEVCFHFPPSPTDVCVKQCGDILLLTSTRKRDILGGFCTGIAFVQHPQLHILSFTLCFLLLCFSDVILFMVSVTTISEE